MEMDSPGWAPLICWAVSLTGWGQSLSKARWCIAGTVLGVVAAIAITGLIPQAPWMFIPVLALWTGLCLFIGSFASNFRSYGWGLAGFTTVIVAMDASPDGNNVFWLGMSRGTYIILGVLCEAFTAFVFSRDPAATAREGLRETLTQTFGNVCRILAAALDDKAEARQEAELEVTSILGFDGRIEFLAIEMGRAGHVAAHARATLTALASALAHLFGAPLHYPLPPNYRLLAQEGGVLPEGVKLFRKVRALLNVLPVDLLAVEAPVALFDELAQLRAHAQTLSAQMESTREARDMAGEMLSLTVLADLLRDVESAAVQFRACLGLPLPVGVVGNTRFPRASWRDPVLALENGAKISTAVVSTSLIYEITAWPEGKIFVAFTSIICCLFGASPTPAVGSFGFLAGMLAAALSAFILDVFLIPRVWVYEGLMMCYTVMLLLSCAARVGPRTAVAGIAYGFMLFPMTVVSNQGVMNALDYFNRVQAMVLASMIAVLTFRIVFPFNLGRAANRIRLSMLRELRALCAPHARPSERVWIARSLGRFSHLSIHTPRKEAVGVQAYLFGLLSTMSLGLNLIRLRALLHGETLPPKATQALEAMLAVLHQSPGQTVQAAQLASEALVALNDAEITPQDKAAASGCLLAIERVLLEDRSFLSLSQPPVVPADAFPQDRGWLDTGTQDLTQSSSGQEAGGGAGQGPHKS